jgi:hypothetical protein
MQGADDAETGTHNRALPQSCPIQQDFRHFHHRACARGRVDAGTQVLARVFRHDAKANEIAARRGTVGNRGSHHAVDVVTGINNAGE